MPITHKDIIISMLYTLGGDKKPIDLETLTVSCFKVFPSKFSMDRFSEYPRFDKIEKRMNEIELNGYVCKDTTFHYKLTEKGTEWVKNNMKIIELINKHKEKQGISLQNTLNYNVSDYECEIETKKLRRSDAYKKFIGNEKDKISIIDFMAFLKTDIYAKKELFDRKVTRIKSICSRDNKLSELFKYLENRYGTEYGDFNKAVREASVVAKRGPA